MDRAKYQNYVLNALKYIEENLTGSIRLENVCALVPVSSWQFQRVFRFFLRTSIGAYIRSRRLTEAYFKILQRPETKIINLAFEFQFTSHEAFTRAFKTYFGFLPSEALDNERLFNLKKNTGLDKNKLDIIWTSIKNISHIQMVESFHLIGFPKEINSPFSIDGEFENTTMLLWNEFFAQTKGLEKTEYYSTKAYGVALNSEFQLISNQMNYFASKKGNEFKNWPASFSEFEMPAHHYAQFTITGSLSQIQTLVDYVYGIWLPASGLERSSSYDWECFDFKNYQHNGQIEYQYNIPVEKKV